jgi:hypothetical protein
MLASHQENEVCYANPCEGLNPVVKMQGLIPPLECEDLSNWEEIRETYAGITCFQCFFARAKKLMRVLTRSNRRTRIRRKWSLTVLEQSGGGEEKKKYSHEPHKVRHISININFKLEAHFVKWSF